MLDQKPNFDGDLPRQGGVTLKKGPLKENSIFRHWKLV